MKGDERMVVFQVSEIFNNLDDSGDRLIEFEEFKESVMMMIHDEMMTQPMFRM